MQRGTGISTAEFETRQSRLLEYADAKNLSGCVLFDQHYIRYFTGFPFLATERPVAVVIGSSGDIVLYVPEFEVERVRSETGFDRIESYPEYPGIEHPMRVLQVLLVDMGVAGTFGADSDGYPGILGYSGPSLSEVSASRVIPLTPFIESLMVRKSEAEVALIRESGRWCSHAHALLQQYTRPGMTETEASLRASCDATLAMLSELGSSDGGQSASSDGATAGYRGQIGRRSSWAQMSYYGTGGSILAMESA
jgi:Xaa-Pro aminopeptidase